jgi:hypothetical protein
MENPFPTEPPPSDTPAASAQPEGHSDASRESAPPPSDTQAGTEPGAVETNSDTLQQEHSPVEEPATEELPEAAAESASEPPADTTENVPAPDTVEHYAARAQKGRLNPEEETEATRLFKEALLGGRAEVARAVAVTPQLPWMVTVQATASVWPEIKPTFRAQFLAGLARTAGEAAARIRLSLARGLFKVDAAAALKLILLTLKMLRDKETGLLEGKGASTLANVLIGRGKAWILQLPLGELKPAESDLLVFAALHGAFHQPQAPLTQLSMLKWAAAADKLTKLPTALDQIVLKGISRWNGKWQASLRREVSPLPDSWIEILKSPAPAGTSRTEGPAPSQISAESDSEAGETVQAERLDRSRDSSESEDGTDDPEEDTEDDGDVDDDAEGNDDESESEDSSGRAAKRQKQRPVYVSKTVPGPGNQGSQPPQYQSKRGGPQTFNLQETLRQVEQYVAALRGELQTAQKQLRQREDENRRQRRNERPALVTNPGELSLEEAIRLNHQLESRNAELQSRIDELTLDSEARAASRGLVTDAPVPDPNTELRMLLGFKLKEDFEDFQALEQEARDIVVQQHYRTLLRHVFDVLEGEGVRFDPAPAQ